MKLIAFYLPQFHEIVENNQWWGKGFTEWTNIKKAKPLFEQHHQPRIPLKENYYDLSDLNEIKNQIKLAKKYGIEGFCFYHYWFDGKLLLQKPVKMLLDNKDINFKYCFSWANEPWTRSWDGKTREILIDQHYGTEENWQKHFDYFINFFKDKRYIKIDNKPILLIYKADHIPNLNKMLDFFNQKAKENELQGVYFIYTNRGTKKKPQFSSFSAQVEFEPTYTLYTSNNFSLWLRRLYRYFIKLINKIFKKKLLTNIPRDVRTVFSKSIKNKPLTKEILSIPGAFVSWDNSPRRGNEASIMKNFDLFDFEEYLLNKMLKAKEVYKSEYLFINAWNEWCEGTYLEPDQKYGYGYLESVHSAITRFNNMTK